MGMTMTEKILAKHAGVDSLSAGDLLVSQVDLVLANDITGPPAIVEFNKIGKPVFDKTKIALVPDHFSPCKDIKSATMCKQLRDFAHQHEIVNYFEVGQMGVEHALLPDKGLVAPGEIIIGADSHTCTYGALNALSTGMGSTDIAAAMASGTSWFKVPSAIKVNLTGKFPKYVSGKDLILTLIGMIGVDGARYQSIEFSGDGIAELTMADRLTICNMAIEAGAKNGIFPVDEKTIEFLTERGVTRPWEAVVADDDAEYEQVIEIDCNCFEEFCEEVRAFNLNRKNFNRAIKRASQIRYNQAVLLNKTGLIRWVWALYEEIFRRDHNEDTMLVMEETFKKTFYSKNAYDEDVLTYDNNFAVENMKYPAAIPTEIMIGYYTWKEHYYYGDWYYYHEHLLSENPLSELHVIEGDGYTAYWNTRALSKIIRTAIKKLD